MTVMSEAKTEIGSEFHNVLATTKGRDDLYLFLQNIFHLYPEDRLHDVCPGELRTFVRG